MNKLSLHQISMGMIGIDGKETIEYPSNSGVKWSRSNPSEEWSKN